MTCTETYNPAAMWGRGEVVRVECFRAPDHRGDHQGWEDMPAGELENPLTKEVETWAEWKRLWTWSAGGARGAANLRSCQRCNGHPGAKQTHTPADHAFVVCANCGALYDPHGHYLDSDMQEAPTGSCFSCRLWWVRAEAYAQPMNKEGQRIIRPHDALASQARIYTWSKGHGGAFGGRQFVVEWDDGQVEGPADFLWDGGQIPWWWLDYFPPNGTITPHSETVRRSGHTNPFGGPLSYTGHPQV